MQDVPQWLEGLGLGQHAAAFVDNDIDFRALPHLTEQDLKDLGLSLGHRRILLAAIAQLDGREPAPAHPPGHDDLQARAEAERRQLTVMFCDLVGSTELSTILDPEDFRDVMGSYQEACSGVVESFDGHVAKYLGDGILVYFGYPRAHEDDAERAVRAGLGIVDGVADLNRSLASEHGLALAVRLGVHTGLVVAGEMGGGEAREADAIVGETPNIAARIQELAEPNTLVISAATERLVAGLFILDDLGPQQLKGVSQPMQALGVRGASDAPSRFQAAVVTDLRLYNKTEAIELYRQVIQHEQFNASNVQFAHNRIRDLTKS